MDTFVLTVLYTGQSMSSDKSLTKTFKKTYIKNLGYELPRVFFVVTQIFIIKLTIMAKQIIRLTESDLHNIVKESAEKIIKEAWNNDRFEYDHLSDTGNGGLEEYGLNIAQLIYGQGSDSDALHALGEETAQQLLAMYNGNPNDMEFGKNDAETYLKPFIEGLIAVYKNPTDPYEVYKQHGIVRN